MYKNIKDIYLHGYTQTKEYNNNNIQHKNNIKIMIKKRKILIMRAMTIVKV